MLTVRNLTNNKGKSIANQFVICNGFNTTFQSYTSTIVEIDILTKTITIYQDYDYSNTTIRNRNIFFKNQGFDDLSTTKGLEKAIEKGFIQTNFDGVYTIEKAA